ncbi:unnamed protein product [Arabis nemorensis]|uniref:Uncharacterized protein n=1 Tax=Arabis nemorensis TaxID=586526 RepID=A0A565BUC6_9BRAS|nr:unnamed protein product [Arabis nemorensis]
MFYIDDLQIKEYTYIRNSRSSGKNIKSCWNCWYRNIYSGWKFEWYTRKTQYMFISLEDKWSPSSTEIFLKLIIAELEAEDYTIRIPSPVSIRRIEEKIYDLIGDSVKWDPEMKGKFNYLKQLWYYNNILLHRTGVSVDPVRTNPNVTIMVDGSMHSKFLNEHDVEQDDRYSPHVLGVHLAQSNNDETYNDDVPVGETEEDGRTSFPPENRNPRSFDDDDSPRLSRSPSRSTRDPPRNTRFTTTRTSSSCARNSSRTHMRRINFETQIDSRFQRMEESRSQILDVVRSRQTS